MKSRRLALITSAAFPLLLTAPALALNADGAPAAVAVPPAPAPALRLAQTPEELLVPPEQAPPQEEQQEEEQQPRQERRQERREERQQERQQEQQQEEQQEERQPERQEQQEAPAEAAPEQPPAPERAEPPPEPAPEAEQPPEPPARPEPEPAPAPAPEAAPPEPPPPVEQTQPETPTLEPPAVEPPPVETPAPPVERPEPPAGETPSTPPAGEPTTPPTLEPPPAAEPTPPAVDQPSPGAPSGPAQPAPGGQPGGAAPSAPGGQTAAPPAEGSAVESQYEAQGDREAVDNIRNLRARLRDELERGGEAEGEGRRDGQRGPGDEARRDGDRRDGDRRERPRPPDSDVVVDLGGRYILQFGDRTIVRQDRAYEADRFLSRARDVRVERERGGYERTIVVRDDGTQIITVRDRYGDIVSRSRVDPRGREVILIDDRDFYREDRPRRFVRFEDELPPLRIDIPRERYIVETSRADRDAIYAALTAPPVERIERRYAVDEIRTSERLRAKMPRVDLNTITFDFGSAAISPSQFDALTAVGQALEQALSSNPDQLFLIEGHTDAVGSDNDNLILSDQRAEAIAVALSSNFDIPPENLVTQGYGEQYLKVESDGPEEQNRRVTIRNITELAQGG